MTIEFSNSSSLAKHGVTNENTPVAAGSQATGSPAFQSLLDQFTDYAKGTTGERLEKIILARLSITEEELKKMSPEERDKIMAGVHELLKKEMDAQLQLQHATSELLKQLSM